MTSLEVPVSVRVRGKWAMKVAALFLTRVRTQIRIGKGRKWETTTTRFVITYEAPGVVDGAGAMEVEA